MHYRAAAVSLKRLLTEAGVNDTVEIQGTVTDSFGASVMPSDLYSCSTTLCSNMNAAFRETAGPAGPVQEAPDGLFHSILAGLDTVTDMPTRTASSIEAWHMRAAILRCYSYLLLLQDAIDSGVSTVDMDAQYQNWLAHVSAASEEEIGRAHV